MKVKVSKEAAAELEEPNPPLTPVLGNAASLGAKKLILHRFPLSLVIIYSQECSSSLRLPTTLEILTIGRGELAYNAALWGDINALLASYPPIISLKRLIALIVNAPGT